MTPLPRFASALLFAALVGPAAKAESLFDHHRFEDFSKGTFSDSGANLYASRNGRLQFISLWDLNGDGYPEVTVNNDHNHYETPDVLVYHNRSPWGLRSLFSPMHRDTPAYQNLAWTLESLSSITRLPAEGGGKALLEDLTGSGYPDLLFTNFVHGSTLNNLPIYLYWGGPDGYSMRRRSLLPVDRGTGLAAGDLNGDGLKDIVVSNAGRENLVSQTDGFSHDQLDKLGGPGEKRSYVFYQTEGGFTKDAVETIPTLFAVDVKIADLDRTGKNALIFLESGKPGALRIIRREQGKWGAPQLLPVLAPTWQWPWIPPCTRQILVKDLNGDGYPDIFVPSAGRASEIFWNDHGRFSVENRTVLATDNALAAAAADLNNDGQIDLVVANNYVDNENGTRRHETNSYIWWGSREGFSADRRTALPTLGATSVCLADVNGTGRLDVLFSQHRSDDSFDIPSCVYLNSPTGFFPGNRLELQGFGAVSILAGDLAKSGKTDVVVVNRQSGREDHLEGSAASGPADEEPDGLPMYIYQGNASGNYGPANVVRVPQSRLQSYTAFADMDDSGSAALVHLVKDGRSLVIRYDVYNYPRSKESTVIPLPFEGKTVNVKDFNQDGILDILVMPQSGAVNQTSSGLTLSGKAAGQGALFFGLGNRQYRMELFEFAHQASDCVLGDINNDGVLDAVTCGFAEICILPGSNQGGFHFEKPIVIPTDVYTSSISLADFSGSGWLDILCQNYDKVLTKENAIESWVLINDHGRFSLDRKRAFHTYGALAGSVAQIWGDGKPAFVNANYLDGTSRRAATMLLRADKDGYPTDEGKVRLPAYSSSGNYVMDFTGSGYLDIMVFNHTGQTEYNGELEPKGGTHGIGSLLYRGSKDGYKPENVQWIPSFGPHFRNAAEPDSLSRRDPFEVYTSPVLNNPTAQGKSLLTIDGRFNQRQRVQPEILLQGKGSGSESQVTLVAVAQSSSQVSYQVEIPPGAQFRYRLKLISSHSGGGPVVSAVRLEAQAAGPQ